MSITDDTTWLTARIEKTEALIVKYEDAIDALSSGAQVYSLDTGQTRQSVTKAQLGSLKNVLASLENRRETLLARLRGRTVNFRPAW